MSPTPAAILESLSASGLLSADDARAVSNAVPPPVDAQSCLDALVARGTLSPYQAKVVLEGRQHELVFGEYIVLDRIGAGGMGEVFKAVHKRMARVVAIKRLPASAMHTPGAVARFYREVQAAAKLTHPNIVAAYDAGEAHGTHFLVMEFVDGRDLSNLIMEQGRLPIERAVEIIRQAATGLAYAHGKGVIHRDIKPGNILITSDGTVKLLDMGLARVHQTGSALGESSVADEATQASAGPELTLTQEGRLMGTVEYMAPEQAADAHAADARADIYSLGCTLYRILTGKLPFTGSTAVAKILAHTTAPIPMLMAERTDVPEELEAVYLKMVAKKPEERFQSMQEVIAALSDPACCRIAAPEPRTKSAESAKPRKRDKETRRGEMAEEARQAPTLDIAMAPSLEASSNPILIDPATIPVARSRSRRKARDIARARESSFLARSWPIFAVAGVALVVVAALLVSGRGKPAANSQANVDARPSTAPGNQDSPPAIEPPAIEPPVTPPVVPPTPPPAPFTERELAQRLLDLKIPLNVKIDGRPATVQPGQPLPTAPFHIDQFGACEPFGASPEQVKSAGAGLAGLSEFQGGYLPRRDSDLWAQAFAAVPTVQVVNSMGCDLTDQGLAALAKSPSIRYLNLTGCDRATLAGLFAFAGHPTLIMLNIDKAEYQAGKYPPAELQRLQDALPFTRFIFAFGEPVPGLTLPSPSAEKLRSAALQWSKPESLAAVNTDAMEELWGVSDDALTIHFARSYPSIGLYRVQRATRSDAFGEAVRILELPQFCMFGSITGDGLEVVCWKGVPSEVWTARRKSPDEPFGSFEKIAALSDAFNVYPVLSPDGLTLVTASRRPGAGAQGIWMLTRSKRSEPFGNAVRLAEASTPHWDMPAYISNDRRVLIAMSQQTVSDTVRRDVRWFTRAKATEPFAAGELLPLPVTVPTDSSNGGFFPLADGQSMLFNSAVVEGGSPSGDIYVTRRVPKAPTDGAASDIIDLLKTLPRATDGVLNVGRRGGTGGANVFFRHDAIPAEYDLELELGREPASGPTEVVLVVGGRVCTFRISPGDRSESPVPKRSGLGLLDDLPHEEPRNPTSVEGGALIDEQVNRVICQVRKRSVKATVNGKTIVDWSGDPSRLSPHLNLKGSVDRSGAAMGLVQWTGHLRCTKAVLRPIAAGQIDLLALIDPAKDAVGGGWKLENGALKLVATAGGKLEPFSRLAIPVITPPSYNLRVKFTTGDRRGIGVLLPVAGRQVLLGLANPGGIGAVDGRPIAQPGNPANAAFELKAGQLHAADIAVKVEQQQATIVVQLDDKQVLRWQGDVSRLGPEKNWNLRTPQVPGFAEWGLTPFTVHEATLDTLGGMSVIGRSPLWGSPANAP